MRQLSLRARFLWGILFSVGLALCLLAYWAMWANQRVEQGLLNDVMRTHMALFAGYLARNPGAIAPPSEKLHFYKAGAADMPPEIAGLAPGCHKRVAIGGRRFQVLIQDLPPGRLYVTFDGTQHERRAGDIWGWFYLIFGVTLMFTAVIAHWASRSIVSPVTSLADRLSRIDPRERNQRLGLECAPTELKPITSSIDRFLERLDGFVEREQSFTATASHELRTPLAVIQGATEILAEQNRERPTALKAVSRIRRATSEMSEFIQALLLLAREAQVSTDPGEACDIGDIVPRVLDDQRELLNGRPISLKCECCTPLRVQAPESMVTIVISNLFRNAIAHTEHGAIACEIEKRTLSIRDSGPGIAPEHLGQVFDRNFTTRAGGYGVGLYLSKRICDRYGWQIALRSTPAGTVASVTF